MSAPRGPMFGSDDPLPMLLEAAVRLVGLIARSVFRLVRFALRRPRVASAGMAVVALDRYAGHAAVVVLLAAALVGVGVWRLAWPDSYRGQARPRLHAFWLRLTYAEGAVRVQASLDGQRWPLLRLAPFPELPALAVGPMCCSPERAGLQVEFRDFTIGPASTAGLHDLG